MLRPVGRWISLIAGFSGAISLAATTLESYVAGPETRPDWLPEDAVAVGVILICGLFHAVRPRVGAAFQNATVLVKLALLLAFVVYAYRHLPQVGWAGSPLPEMPTGCTHSGMRHMRLEWT